MTAAELRLARLLAESNVDLSHANYDVMIGFGCADFVPVTVGLEAVARMMRYQCCQMDGGWDEATYNEDLPHYRRNIHLATAQAPEVIDFLVTIARQRLRIAA